MPIDWRQWANPVRHPSPFKERSNDAIESLTYEQKDELLNELRSLLKWCGWMRGGANGPHSVVVADSLCEIQRRWQEMTGLEFEEYT